MNSPAPYVAVSMTDLQVMAAECALAKMAKGTHFSICPVNDILTMLGSSGRGTDAYKVLNTLHCVDWTDMPPQLRSNLPALIKEAISAPPAVDFSQVFEKRCKTVDVPATPVEKVPPKSFFKRLVG